MNTIPPLVPRKIGPGILVESYMTEQGCMVEHRRVFRFGEPHEVHIDLYTSEYIFDIVERSH